MLPHSIAVTKKAYALELLSAGALMVTILSGCAGNDYKRVAVSRLLAVQADEMLSQESLQNTSLVGTLLALESYALAPEDTVARSALFKARRLGTIESAVLRVDFRMTRMALRPDGAVFAIGGLSHKIELRETGSYKLVEAFPHGHGDRIGSIAFSPDGKILATGGADKVVRMWDTASWTYVRLVGHGDSIESVAFSPDGQLIATASLDKTVRLWDVATGKAIGEPMTAESGVPLAIAFSSEGKSLAVGSSDGSIQLWRVDSRSKLGEPLLGHTGAVRSIAVRADGVFASGAADKTVRLWDMRSLASVGELHGHEGVIGSVAFSPDGNFLASASRDGTIRIWELAGSARLIDVQHGIDRDGISIAYTPGGHTLISAGGKRVLMWSLARPLWRSMRGHTELIEAVAISPDGKTIATGSLDKTVQLWDVARGEPVSPPLIGHQEGVRALAFSPDGKMIATASDRVRFWDVSTAQELVTHYRGHEGRIVALAFSPNGRTMASASWDRTIRLWDIATRAPIGGPMKGHNDFLTSVAFSPDGGALASGGYDNTVRIWDVANRTQIGEGLPAPDIISSLAFGSDGTTLAASYAGAIQLWDITTMKPLGRALQGLSHVNSVGFRPDGTILAAAGGMDRTIRLWNVANRTPLGDLRFGHERRISAMAYSQDGRFLASVDDANQILVWDVDFDSWPNYLCERISRNFTAEEWADFFGSDTPYRKTCKSLP